MWTFKCELRKGNFLWFNKKTNTWEITESKKIKPIGDTGYYVLYNLLAAKGI